MAVYYSYISEFKPLPQNFKLGPIRLKRIHKGNNKISEQSNKGKVKTHKYINRQNQSTTGKLKTVMTIELEI